MQEEFLTLVRIDWNNAVIARLASSPTQSL
jgi:hypothetical protein